MKRYGQDCPRIEALSALIDGELTGRDRDEMVEHAAVCAVCAPMFARFGELRTALSALGDTPAGVDIAALVEPRLPARGYARPVRARRPWRWQIAPAGFAAAGVLAMGAYLGFFLVGGATVGLTRPVAMAVFDAIPPGGLCAGLPSCAPRGR